MAGKTNKKPVHPKTGPTKKAELIVRHWVLPALLAFTAALYSKSFFYNFTGLDDGEYVANNPDIRNLAWHNIQTIFTSFYAGHYQPVTMLAYMFTCKFFGLNPAAYHTLNVLLHLINVALVYKLAERLSGSDITALIVAALFAVHPMHLQSVLWVSQLKDVLYSLFFLLSLLAYLKYISSGYRWLNYAAATAFFFVSLLCKSAAVTLPVLFFVIDFYRGRKITWRTIAEKLPLLALSLGFGILALISQNKAAALKELMFSYSSINNFFVFTSGLAYYFVWLVFPVNLCLFHFFPETHNGLLPWFYYASLPVVLLIAWLVIRPKGFRKDIWFGVAFFLIAISVMLKVINAGSALVAERYTYISYIGLFYIIAQIAAKYYIEHRRLTIVVISFFFLLLSLQSWNSMDVWKNSDSLFSNLIEKNPDFFYGYFLRAIGEKHEGNLQAALADYSKAIELNKTFDDSYYDRGYVNNALGNFGQAIADYSEAIKLNPKLPDSYNNRGWAYYQLGDKNRAIEDYRKAVALNPNYGEAFNNIAWAYDQAGETDSAIANYTHALVVQPGDQKPLYNMVRLKARSGNFEAALQDCNLLIKLYPQEASDYMLRAKIEMDTNNKPAACADWQKARDLGNENAAQLINQYCI